MCKARRKRWVFICANMKALLKEQKKLEKKLTPKQRKFCEYYIEFGGNASKAAKAAGYSKKTARQQGSRLLTNVDIAAYTRILQKLLIKSSGLSKESLLLDLVEIKNRCLEAKPVQEWNYDTHQLEDTGEFTFDAKNAIKAITQIEKMCEFSKQDEDGKNEDGVKIVIGNNEKWCK